MSWPSKPNRIGNVATACLSRRRLLAATATGSLAATAGCATIVDTLADQILEDVNIFNGTGSPRTGGITVTGPTGETILDTEFAVEADTDDEETDSSVAFADVFDGTGGYGVAVDLASEDGIRGETEFETDLEVDAPEEEHIIVGLTPGEENDPFEVFVIEQFTDIGDQLDETQT